MLKVWLYRTSEEKLPPTCPCQSAKKLATPVTGSHVTGLQTIEVGSVMHKAVGMCPEVTVQIGAHPVRCLLDTEAQVLTITESFFKEHIAQDLTDVSEFICIIGGHGQEIPYVRYIELPLQVAGQLFKNMGFLVVKDPIAGDMVD